MMHASIVTTDRWTLVADCFHAQHVVSTKLKRYACWKISVCSRDVSVFNSSLQQETKMSVIEMKHM